MNDQHIGSNFGQCLAEEAFLEDAAATGMGRVIAWQIAREMKAQKLSKTAMATKMPTGRAALNRLLGATDTSLTLKTLAAGALWENGSGWNWQDATALRTVQFRTSGIGAAVLSPVGEGAS